MLTGGHHDCRAIRHCPQAAKSGATLGCAESKQIMGRQKPLGLAIVQEWLAAWDKSNIFSDASVRHLQSLITDPFCLVVVTLGIGRKPRSSVFRRVKYTLPPVPPKPNNRICPAGRP
jgi:hypothetical protein